jgi:hypothetical protein
VRAWRAPRPTAMSPREQPWAKSIAVGGSSRCQGAPTATRHGGDGEDMRPG